MEKWYATLLAMLALVICFCLLPAQVNAEVDSTAPSITIDELEAVLRGESEINPEIGPESYDIDKNGIVENDDLVVLKYLQGEGEPLADLLPSGEEEDMLSTLELSVLQTALVRGDSTRALILNNEVQSVTFTFSEAMDLSQRVYLWVDTLCLNGGESFTVTFHSASGDLQPITIRSLKAGWSTLSVYLPTISAEELTEITGFTILLDSENTAVIDNVYIDGTAPRVQVTFSDSEETYDFAVGYPFGKLPVPVKDGYLFDGWYDNADCTGTSVTSETEVPAADQTLYASWVASKEIKIDFSTDALRQSQTSEEQIWKNGRVVFTNTKTTSSNNVSANVNPVRLYKGSIVTISCAGMGKIAVTSDSGKDYTTALADTLDNLGVSYYVNDNIYTIVFDKPVDVFEIPSVAGQIRLVEISVSTVNDGSIPDHEVTFNLNYDESPAAPVSLLIEEGCAYVALPEVSREGYIFGGWYLNAECTGDAVTAGDFVTAAHTLYAKWTAEFNPDATKDVIIDFTSVGHRVSQSSEEQVWRNNGVTLTNAKTSASSNVVADYNPVKFYTHSALMIEAKGITKIVFTGNTTAYAEPLVTSITGGSANVKVLQSEKVVTVTFADPVDVFEIGDITAQVRLSSIVVTVVDDGTTPETPKYEVTFDLNYDDAPEAPASRLIEEGSSYGTLPAVSREGYIFGGWHTDPECSGDAVAADTKVTDSHTLYAKWTAIADAGQTKDVTIDFGTTTHRVMWDSTVQVWANDGVTLTNNKASSQNTVIDSSNPVRLYANSSVTISANGISKIVFNANTTGYATALDNSIAPDPNIGVSTNSKVVTVIFAEAVDSFEITKLSAQVRLDSIVVTVSSVDEPGTDEDPEIYDVTFDLNYQGATGAPATVQVTAGSTYGDLPTAEREGYTFDGWYLDDEGTGEAVTAGTAVYKSHTLYAKWTAVAEPEPEPDPDVPLVPTEITITFDENKTYRTEYSTLKQVWVKDGLTLTNEKKSSQTDVGNYSNPLRLYAKSSLLIECKNMQQVVIVSNGTASYKTALTDSLNSVDATFTTNGNVYTITATGDSFSIPSLSGQVRFVSITVTALVPDTTGESGGTGEEEEGGEDVVVTPSGEHVEPSSIQYSYGNPDSTSYTGVIKNWGIRGDVATSLSPNALAFYTARNTELSKLAALSGSTTLGSVPESEAYVAYKALMAEAHRKQTTYDDVRYLMGFTDCEEANSSTFSLLYCAETISAAWDGGTSFNREHCWPKSKTTGSTGTTNVDADIMTLRPATPSNNGSRSDKAFGTTTTTDYFYPNQYLPDGFDIRGDMARTLLYTYVRWGETGLTGTGGAIESVDVLLGWIEADPVDTWELGRNDSVESITGTRNIFVDYPELAFVLFGEDVPANMQTPSNAD